MVKNNNLTLGRLVSVIKSGEVNIYKNKYINEEGYAIRDNLLESREIENGQPTYGQDDFNTYLDIKVIELESYQDKYSESVYIIVVELED